MLIEVADELILERITGRRSDPTTGRIYHITFDPPAPGVTVVQRADDTEEACTKRLVKYHGETEPILPFYERKGILKRVDGVGNPDRDHEAHHDRPRPLMAGYDHTGIDQQLAGVLGERDHTFATPTDRTRPKYYVLDMFPYPSGDGLHVGHPKGYTATDVVARAKRMMGFNVLRVMGWDSFGLPAERRAERTGEHPSVITARNIATFKGQLQKLGLSYDWSRELATSDPYYYKWTQWIFERAVRARARVPRRGAGQLLPGARHRARERRGQGRQVHRDR